MRKNKSLINNTGKLLLFLLFVIYLVNIGAASAITAEEVVLKADDVLGAEDFVARVHMEVIKDDKVISEYKMIQRMREKGEKVFILFAYPAYEKGQKFLRAGSDSWIYFPSNNKVLRLPAALSIGESDFSNHDILSVRVSTDYTAELIGEEDVSGVNCYKLQLKAKSEFITYDKVIYWVSKENFLPVRRDFYTKSGRLLKTLEFKDTTGPNGRPKVFEMKNVLEKNKRTVMHYLNIKWEPQPSEFFNKSYLTAR